MTQNSGESSFHSIDKIIGPENYYSWKHEFEAVATSYDIDRYLELGIDGCIGGAVDTRDIDPKQPDQQPLEVFDFVPDVVSSKLIHTMERFLDWGFKFLKL